MRKIKTLRSLRVEMLGAFWRFTMAENRRVLHEIRGSKALNKDEYDSGRCQVTSSTSCREFKRQTKQSVQPPLQKGFLVYQA